MCTRPNTINGYEVSCRECDHCLATYKNSWIARCVAEKQTLPHAYAFTLTYANVDGEPPLGARVYRYKDVSDMWKRIRSAGKRKWNEVIDLSYVVVGEKGSEKGRCHYHGVFFSSRPLHELGTLNGKRGEGLQYKRRLNWSLWGHGFVEFQPATREGMAYALKYILKSRMTAARSKGYAREGKTEWLASSYLWCSKQPSIGSAWLRNKLDDLYSKGMCPSSLRVTVPGGGEWYISGELQKEMCLILHDANKEFRAQRGRDLAGWKPLLQSCSQEIENSETGEIVPRKSWEWLTNGEISEEVREYTDEEKEAEFEKLHEDYARKRRVGASITNARATLQKCGGIIPCELCSKSISFEQLVELEREYYKRCDEWAEKNKNNGEGWARERQFKDWWLTRLRPSRGCQLRNTSEVQDDFRKLVPLYRATQTFTHREAIGKAL